MKVRITVVEAPPASGSERANAGDVFTFEVAAGRIATIGRGGAPYCEISVASTNIGRQHMVVEASGGEVWLRDNYTTNGTWVDGERIERIRLSAESATTARVGDLLVAFQLAPTPETEARDIEQAATDEVDELLALDSSPFAEDDSDP